jgi:hypothetical protein
LITTPFGVPVEPEVKRMCAASSGRLSTARASADWESASARENAVSKLEPASGSSSDPMGIASERSARTSSSSFAAGSVARISAGSEDSTIISTRGAGLAMSIGT